MNSLRRMLQILDLYGPDTPVLDVDTIGQRLDYPPATIYRYLKELCACGLLIRSPGGYAPGPRFIEMDLLIREFDPLITRCRPLLRSLVEQTGLDVLIGQLYGDRILSTHQETGPDRFDLMFGRGRTMDMFRSATARVVTAHLPTRQLRRLYDTHQHLDYVQRLGAQWPQFSAHMQDIRRAGYCVSQEQINPGIAGISAPIFDDAKRIFGSLTLLGSLERFHALNQTALATLIQPAARAVSQALLWEPRHPDVSLTTPNGM
ncbi:IclR family transcriptional regulator [Alcaligenes sp. SDU_A2]|uniref:IclR family transcriptional regulator n=1 Tax=Alcaligenes sp. SDU_A2 TaxID=3136634 RepID=UPI00311F732B